MPTEGNVISVSENGKYTIVIDPKSKCLSSNDLCGCLFEKSLDKLAQDIRKNVGGKYDSLYS